VEPTSVARTARALTPTSTGAPPKSEPIGAPPDDIDAFMASKTAEPPTSDNTAPPDDIDAFVASKAKAPAQPPSDDLDTFVASKGSPASLSAQNAIGYRAYQQPPDLHADEQQLFAAAHEMAKLTNGDPVGEAIATINSSRRQKAQSDHTQSWSPFGIEGATDFVKGHTTPGGLPYRAAEAFGPQWYGDKPANEKAAYWRAASTDGERKEGRTILTQAMINAGVATPEQAKAIAQARFETNSVLMIPTTDNPDFGAAQADMNVGKYTTTPLRNSLKQGAVDVGVGLDTAASDVANAAKHGVEFIGNYAKNAREVVTSRIPGMAEANLEPLDYVTGAKLGSDFTNYADNLAAWLETKDNATASALAHRIRDARSRNAGVLAGTAEIINASPDWTHSSDIDPADDGVVNALWRKALSNPPPEEGPAASIADQAAATFKDTTALPAKLSDIEAKREAGRSNLASGIAASAATAGTLLDAGTAALGAATARDVQGRESSAAWFMRVPVTALSALVTTWAARAADYSAVSLGATSARRHRVPGDPEMTAWEAFAPVIMSGSGLHDYLTAVENGDALTSEAMRFSDTLASMPQWSDETRTELLPGGAYRDLLTRAAMVGDLTLHLDEVPLKGVGFVADAGGFAHGYYKMRKGALPGMSASDAAALEGARTFPTLTHRLMMKDPVYAAAHNELAAREMDAVRDALAKQGRTVTPDELKKLAAPPDEDSVRFAAGRAYARRAMDAGHNPAAIAKGMGRAKIDLANAVRERATTLRLTPEVLEAALREREGLELAPDEAPVAPAHGTEGPLQPGVAAPPSNLGTAREAAASASGTVDAAPIGKWPTEVLAEKDPATRAGMALGAIAERMGHPPGKGDGAARLALRAALSTYDPRTGLLHRFGDATNERIRKLDPTHLAMALNRLRDASPEQIHDNVAALQSGRAIRWTDERVPDRQRVRDELYALHAEGHTGLKPEDIEAALAIGDNDAQNLVRIGAIDHADAWWAKQSYRTMGEEARGVEVLGQDAAPTPHVTDKTGIDTGAFGGATHAHQAVAWIAGNSKDPQMAAMARRILPLVPTDVPLNIIQAGTTYTFGYGREDVPTSIHGALGVFRHNTNEPGWNGDIWLRGSSFKDGTTGINEVTMLHEAIHAAVDKRIIEGNLVKTPDGPAKAGAKMFYDLNNDLVRWYNAQQKAGTLPAFAKSDRFLNAMNSPRELATYGLTDKLVQDAFRQINLPGESKSLWTRFVSSLRGILGLAPTDESALARVADATNTILSDVLGDQGLLEERPHGERLPMTVEDLAREEKRGKLSYEIDNKGNFFSALREKVKVREYASQKALTNSVLAGEPLTVEAIRAAGGTATEADIAALQPAVDKLRAAFEPVAPRWTEDLQFGEEVPDDVRTRDVLYQDRPIRPRTVTLFSGGGLVEEGLRGLVDPVAAVEHDPNIASVYEQNHGKHVRVGDVRDVDLADAGPVDYLHASPVCKNFSIAKNIDSESGEQPIDLATAEATGRAIRTLQPRMFTLENVKGYQGSEAMKVIESALRENGYTFDARVYDAADYGAATHRQRLLLRATREGTLPPPPRPTYGPAGMLGVQPYHGWFSTVSDIVNRLPDDTVPPWMRERLVAAGVSPDAPGRPVIVMGGSAGRNVPFAWGDEPAPTIKATPREAHRIILPDGTVKRVTPEAMARITGLPDSYKLPADKSLATTIIGNGVPPDLARAVFGPLVEPVRAADVLAQDREAVKSATANVGTFDPKNPSILYQDRPAPIGAKELRERLDKTNFITNARLMEILGDQRPEYLDAVASFILEQRAKVRDGLLTDRDVAKAYIMATASQGSGAMDARAVEQVIGSPLSPEFTVTSKRGQRLVRPEEAMAAWLFSPMGQRALDAVERGVYDAEAWQSAARVRKAFGDDRINNLNVLGEPKKGAANMRNIGEVTAALNEAGGDWKKVEASVAKLNGVAVGKSPFIGHLLGFGEMPTLDAREINGWLTGRGDIGALDTPRANLARAFSEGISSAPLARAFMAKIQDRFLALKKKGVPGTDLPPEVFGAIMHHWLWDKIGGTETTHEGLYKAMRLAQDEAPTLTRKGEIDFTHFVRDGRAIIRLGKTADISTLLHERAHLLRRILPAEHMKNLDAFVQEKFGGWTREAEEWFAEQHEAVFRTGKLELRKGDVVAPTWRKKIESAIRYVADSLQRIYAEGKLPEVHPVFAKWMEDFAGLHLEIERVAADPPVEPPKKAKRPGLVRIGGEVTIPGIGRDGWGPEMLADLERRAAEIQTEKDPAVRKKMVDAFLHEAHASLKEEKSVGRRRHVLASKNADLVVNTMLAVGRDVVKGMSEEERVAADAARTAPVVEPVEAVVDPAAESARSSENAPRNTALSDSTDAIITAMKRPNRLRLTEMTEPVAVQITRVLAERAGDLQPSDFNTAAEYLRALHPDILRDFLTFRSEVDRAGADVVKKGASAADVAAALDRRLTAAQAAVDTFVQKALPPSETPRPTPLAAPAKPMARIPDEYGGRLLTGPALEVGTEGHFVVKRTRGTFKTAKGSVYELHSDGTTTRMKSVHPEHPGDEGLKPRSERTFFVTEANAEKLGIFQTQGGVHGKHVRLSGDEAAVFGTDDRTGKVIGLGSSRVPVLSEPAVGLLPVELWQDGKEVHFGNKIVSVERAVGSEPNDAPGPSVPEPPVPPAPEVVPPVDLPPAPTPLPTAAPLAKAVANYAERLRYGSDTAGILGAAKRVIDRLADHVAATKGDPKPASPYTYLGEAATRFIDQTKSSVKTLSDKSLGLQDGEAAGAIRAKAAQEHLADLERRTLPREEPMAAPRSAPDVPPELEVVHAPTPSDAPPEVIEALRGKTLRPAGSPDVDESGMQRKMWDSEGTPSAFRIRAIHVNDIFTSHNLATMDWRPGYDHAFQNRTDLFMREGWIAKVASIFDTELGTRPVGDTPTMGVPTVWFMEVPKDQPNRPAMERFIKTDENGREGVYVALAGNGRTLAAAEVYRLGMMQNADGSPASSVHHAILAALTDRTRRWGAALATGPIEVGTVHVRELRGVTYDEAVRFAQNSQDIQKELMAKADTLLSVATKVRNAGVTSLEIKDIPTSWTKEGLIAYIGENPSVGRALEAAGEKWSSMEKEEDLVAAVRGAFLGVLPPDMVATLSGAGERLLNAVAMAGPAIQMLQSYSRFDDVAKVDPVGAVRDGLALYIKSRTAGSRGTPLGSPARMRLWVDEIRRQYTGLAGAKALPVSAASFHVADALRRLTASSNATGRGFGNYMLDVARDVEASTRPGLSFGGPRPLTAGEALMAALTRDAKDTIAAAEGLPETHTEAKDYARTLDMASIVAAQEPVVEEPPGFVAPLRLFQNASEKTDTPAFKAWFGESKVVDTEGKPLVVYHGTDKAFDAFDPAKRGTEVRDGGPFDARSKLAFWFTSNRETARSYAEAAETPADGRVVEAWVRMTNPLVVNAPAHGDGGYIPDRADAVLRRAIRSGHDGVIFRDVYDGLGDSPRSDVYAVFTPEQVKSATANVGTFDPTNPSILFQHDAYTEAIVPPATPGHAPAPPTGTLGFEDTARDQPASFAGASRDREGHATPGGVLMAKRRAVPLRTREQLLLELGYRHDQQTVDARDMMERLVAHALTYPDQATAPRGRYVPLGNTVSVPVRRAAAVCARTQLILGDLPANIEAAVKRRDAAAPGVAGHEVPIGLSLADAGRIRTVLDVLDASGWADSLGGARATWIDPNGTAHLGDLRGMTTAEIAEHLTTIQYVKIWGAVADSQSGAIPYQGRVMGSMMSRGIVWMLAQRPGGLFTAEPNDATASGRAKWMNLQRERVGAAVQWAASKILPFDEIGAPDMRPDLRVIWQQAVRRFGQNSADFAEAVSMMLEQTVKGGTPGSMLKVVDQVARTLPGATPHIDVRPRNGGPSDLHRLRTWLYRDAPVTYGEGVTIKANGERIVNHVAHDLPRMADDSRNGRPPRPFLDPVAECYQHADLLTRVLAPTTRRVDAQAIDLLNRVRNRTLSADDAAVLIGRMYGALNSAHDLGVEILTSAAGHSGMDDAVAKVLAGTAKFSGIALDAYEAFHQGRWTRPDAAVDATVVDRSVEVMVKIMGKTPTVVETPKWVFETFNRLNLRHAMGQLTDSLMDHNAVLDMTEMAKEGGVNPNDTLAVATFSEEVRRAVNEEMWGTAYRRAYGVDAAGVASVGISGTSVSQEALGVARIIIARMGMRPDMTMIRKGVKGELAGGALARAVSVLDPDPVRRAEQLATPAFWKGVGSNDPSAMGRDLYMYDAMAEHLAATLERHTPLAANLAKTISMRDASVIFDRAVDVYRQLKGSFITGGPNGWVAAATFGAGLAGGGTIAGAAALGGAAWALSFIPRFGGYVTNAISALGQGAIELGVEGVAKAFNLGSKDARVAQQVALRASMETVRYHRIIGARDVVSAILDKLPGERRGLDQIVFATRDGRVYTGADIEYVAKQYGLEGTQARFESAESVARIMDRLYKTYESSPTFTGGLWRQLDAFFGRYKLTENYRRMYEHVDTYFRYLWLVRGVQEGLSPDEAVRRSLRISFDYTATSELDRAINQVFMFWMYQRRALDLTLSALIDHPHTVLGMIRYMNGQRLQFAVASHATNQDYETMAQTEPDYAMERPAWAYLPSAGGGTEGMKLMAGEPAQVTAMRLTQDATTGDFVGMAARANPMLTIGFNGLIKSVGGNGINFFRRQVVSSPGDYKVPMWFVRWDQAINQGAFSHYFDLRPNYVVDPQGRATGVYQDFSVSPAKQSEWDAFRGLVPNFSTLLSENDIEDRADTTWGRGQAQMLLWLAAADPDNRWGIREERRPGSLMTPAVDLHPSPVLGGNVEATKLLGVGVAPVSTLYAAQQRPEIAADKQIKAATAGLKKEIEASRPPVVERK
jgi:site-specific DNA-cytosine methylase